MLSSKDIFVQRTFFTTFWVMACFGFISQEIIPPLDALLTPINLLCNAAMVIMGIMTLRNRTDILLIIAYFFLSFFSTILVNGSSLVTWLNGSRVFLGFLFLIPTLRHFWSTTERHDAFIKQLDKSLMIFLILQAFCITEQWIRYGAGDTGGGTMGNGYSGIVSISIYFISFYLMHKRSSSDKVMENIKNNIWLVVLLFPTFLNETKISFILLLLYFVLLFPINRAFIRRMLVALPFMLLILGGAIFMYVNTANNGEMQLDFDFLANTYLYEDADVDQLAEGVEWVYENENAIPDVPRFTKIAFIPLLLNNTDGHWWFGYGVGLFNGTFNFEPPKIYKEYEWFFIGTVPYIEHVIMQLGLFGCLLIGFMFFRSFHSNPDKKRYVRNKNMLVYVLITFIMTLFYFDGYQTPIFSFIFFTYTFLMWQPKEEKGEAEENAVEEVKALEANTSN